MENNSYVLKRIYKIKKNNSTSLSSLNSNINKNNLFTYDLDKKEDLQNTLGTSKTLGASKFHKKNISTEKNGSYILINSNKKFSIQNESSHKSNIIPSLNEEFGKQILVNKAPTYCENKLEINKIIRKKRLEKLLDYENFHNSMKTINNFNSYYEKNKSKILEDKIIRPNIFNAYNKINNFKSASANNIFLDLINSKKKNKIKSKINTEEDFNEKNTRYSNIVKNNSHFSNRIRNRNIKNMKESSRINDNEKTDENLGTTHTNINNSNGVLMTLLPLIPRSKRFKIKHRECPDIFLEQSQESEGINIYNFSTQKIENDIFLNLEHKTRTVEQFTILEKKIIKLKYFQNIQKKSLENIIKSDKFNIDKKVNFLIKLNKIYNNIWADFRQKINFYLHFLFDKKSDFETKLQITLRKKKINENAIEKLMIQSVKKQKELEELVQTRNFLLQVKLKLKVQPPYFAALLHRDSRKIELGNILITSTVGTKNSAVIKFLDSFSVLNLVQLYEIHPMNSLLKLFRKKINNRRIIPKEFREKYIYQEDLLNNENNNKYIPQKGEIFFDNDPEKFLDIFHSLESKNLFLLHKNNSIKKFSSTIKQEYETKYLSEYDDLHDQEILEEIEYRERYLIKIKARNKQLKEDLKKVSNKEFVDNNIYTKKLIQAQANSSFVELSFFKMINYIKLLEGYKYHGVLLLEKLITIVKTFINLKYGDYTLARCYMFVEEVELNHILKLNKKSFNETNKFKVYDYILQLIKLYDDICEYVKNMQKMYEADDKNRVFMRKRREEVQTMRKISNARETRELLEDKRERVIDKVVEKWRRPVNRVFRKIDDKYNTRMKNKYRSKSVEELEKIKKEKLKNEVEGLIFFE